ncbi:hypothetical protein [Thermogemmatispora sp.]|nr:hypothetical protein [Thermogemmatispora sp.]
MRIGCPRPGRPAPAASSQQPQPLIKADPVLFSQDDVNVTILSEE